MNRAARMGRRLWLMLATALVAALVLLLALVFLPSRSSPYATEVSSISQPTEPAPSAAAAAPPPLSLEAAPIEAVRAPLAWAAAPVQRPGTAPAPQIAGLAAVILDEASDTVIYDKSAYEPLPPASLTKIATLILALEHGDLDAWVDIDVDGPAMRGSTIMGLVPGDRFTLRDLLYGMMLPSGNDAALAIGRHISGNDAAFVARMNLLARRLGLSGTHFLNPHGLGRFDHHMTAADLAVLSRYGMSLPGFREIVTARSWTAKGSRTLPLYNINGFLSYPGADGIKTGYTRSAGSTLAAAATRNGHRLYAVVLNSPSREDDARRLLNWAFASFDWPPK